MEVSARQHIYMLSEEVASKLKRFHWHWSFVNAKCLMKNDDHGPQGVTPPIIPHVPMVRSRVYTGTRQAGSYNHHSQIVRFKGRYYFVWSNGMVDEETEGQRILVSFSDDVFFWSDPVCVAGDKGSNLVHNCLALMSDDDAMYLVGMSEECLKDVSEVGMRRIVPESTCMDIYKSTDGIKWEKVYSFGDKFRFIFETPRLTAEGRFMCTCTTLHEGPAILLWPGSDICQEPEVIAVPEPEEASFPYGEASWYQMDEGRIIVFWRDEGGSCRLYVNYSDDGGRSFVSPMISDIPDSMSRVYAGRLEDGRYYLCNNAFATLLDRRHLMLLLSDDGCEFNKVYILIEDPTSQRLKGLLKVDGYQYPCCLPEGDRLLVGYSVNKEDIELGIIKTQEL